MMYEENTIIAYGCGNSFHSYYERLNQIRKIEYFSDIDPHSYNSLEIGEGIFVEPIEIKNLKNPLVVICVDAVIAIHEISRFFGEMQVPCLHAKHYLELVQLDSSEFRSMKWIETIQNSKIHRFIDLNITGTTTCNFHCEYCYVWRRLGFQGERKLSNRSVDELVKGLSAKRTGGICFINLCARGETLLADGIVELTLGLLREGHYVSIVTNATISNKISEILKFQDDLLQRLFFKISFHYKELKRLDLFDLFWTNVRRISESRCSFTLEVTPGDGTEQLIPEMKEMCTEKMSGALPHISFTRDSTKVGYDLLSDHSINEYKDIWGQFDSKMFDLKSEWYGINMKKYSCYAGAWSYLVNAETGDIKSCYQQPVIGNIFDENENGFPIRVVNNQCSVAYCFNNHAFLAWGDVPQIECSTYLDMRNRVSELGEHWVKEPYHRFMSQKLRDNNFEFINQWSDYNTLYSPDRKKAFILFNSPDYSNLGDHAIALGERKFFKKHFEDYDFIEISCTQYIKEHLRIKEAIKDEDILLITGGGYTGNIYMRLQDVVSHVIENYQKNCIITCPQTMYFEGDIFAESEKRRIKTLYEKHGKLMLAARDESTMCLYRDLFSDSIKKLRVPDLAFYLDYSFSNARNGALICMRNDKENKEVITFLEIERILHKFDLKVSTFSTISSDKVILDNREPIVYEAMNRVSSAELVVTDRLHCAIFCVITNTPCVLIDNTTGKVFELFHSLVSRNIFVQYVSKEHLQEQIPKLLNEKRDDSINHKMFMSEIDRFADTIVEFINQNRN